MATTDWAQCVFAGGEGSRPLGFVSSEKLGGGGISVKGDGCLQSQAVVFSLICLVLPLRCPR